jgi:hypothetical protein
VVHHRDEVKAGRLRGPGVLYDPSKQSILRDAWKRVIGHMEAKENTHVVKNLPGRPANSVTGRIIGPLVTA